jgi:glycosyltransferase involved in cell wall biosynthesis
VQSPVVGGEVILADSYSSDRTVELASAFPIRIVQLANPEERCCGAGPQLGYQHSRGEFVYILDGDMQMREGFLEQALAFLDAHADVAGVGGRVVEQNTESLEYMARGERASAHLRPAMSTGWTAAACTGAVPSKRPDIFPTATCTAMKSSTWRSGCARWAGACGACLPMPPTILAMMRRPTVC